jgi:nucleotide-binding universal stress UspA family protein
MSYKTILVNADLSRRAEQIVACAALIANEEHAHLVGLASSGINPLVYQCNAAAPGAPLLPEDLTGLIANAEQALAQFELVAARHDVSSRECRISDDGLPDSLLLHARYSDLLVIGQADPGQQPPLASTPNVAELVQHCPCPMLVIPALGQFNTIGQRVLIGWDGGMAARHAIHAALPLLRRATLVTLTVLNPDHQYNAHGAPPGADMAQFLSRHGVAVEVMVRDSDLETGEYLLSLAAERAADLLVMGCYGHTRFRELIMDGTSRTVLHSMTLPVLMTK